MKKKEQKEKQQIAGKVKINPPDYRKYTSLHKSGQKMKQSKIQGTLGIISGKVERNEEKNKMAIISGMKYTKVFNSFIICIFF